MHDHETDANILIDPPEEAAGEARLSGRLELRGIRFGYSPLEDPLIDGFDLALTPGARVALVGGARGAASPPSPSSCAVSTSPGVARCSSTAARDGRSPAP